MTTNTNDAAITVDRNSPLIIPEFFRGLPGLNDKTTLKFQDERILGINEIRLADIQLFPFMGKHETNVASCDRIVPLSQVGMLLDAVFCKYFWEHQEFIPETWKTGDFIEFNGTTFKNFEGKSFSLALRWIGDFPDRSRETGKVRQLGMEWSLYTTCFQDYAPSTPSAGNHVSAMIPLARLKK